ncbi:MAG: hypothetical protein H6698_00770 [Myxococcales bacterium]|nr:hypothetical protein [Myxococcales bacterium]
MQLPAGFVVGGRYRVGARVASGAHFATYRAVSVDDDGPGVVAIKVPIFDEPLTPASLQQGRELASREWKRLVSLHEIEASISPQPLELVAMYPGDPVVRAAALQDRATVGQYPYIVVELVAGRSLASFLAEEQLDEDRALLLALRVLRCVRLAATAGVPASQLSASSFVVDPSGENVTCVGLVGDDAVEVDPDTTPPALARVVVALLTGMLAPRWSMTAADEDRWSRLLESRRVRPEMAAIARGALGYDAALSSLDALEDRLRALRGVPRLSARPRAPKRSEVDFPLAPGDRVGDRFEVLRPLAQGGRGFVYVARDDRSGTEVLIKSNKYVYDSGSSFALELATRRLEIEHEWNILRRFSDVTGLMPQPVALVRDLGRSPWFDLAPSLAANEPYLVMELVRGASLRDLMSAPFEGYSGAAAAAGEIPVAFVLRVVAQVADLLDRFHDAGFLHQDIKPENILFDPATEGLFLIDFASVCPRLPSGVLDRAHVAFAVQTHGFAAPEFADRWERTDDRFDIYSLGATAYHLLTGVNPERVAADEGSEYPVLSRQPLRARVPDSVADLVERCLAPVEQRFATAAAVADEARRVALGLSRSRPLDVARVDVTYRLDGIALVVVPPADPRVRWLNVERTTRADEEPHVLYDGPMVDAVVDTDELGIDRVYVVSTRRDGAGARRTSRGRVVRAEALPGPVAFSAQRAFGGIEVAVALAPQATGLILRRSADGPPAQPDAGDPIPLPEDTGSTWDVPHVVFVEGPPDEPIYVSGFACFGDRVSTPRFASAEPLPPVPAIEEPRVEPGLQGIVVSWANDVPHLSVEFVRSREIIERVPGPGARELVFDELEHDEPVIVRMRARCGEARSPILFASAGRAWPASPGLTVVPGLSQVTIAVETNSDQVSSVAVVLIGPDGLTLAPRVGVGDAPLSVALPRGGLWTVTARACVETNAAGPETSLAVDVLGQGLAFDIEDVSADGDRFRLVPARPVPEKSPAADPQGAAGYTLRVSAREREVLILEGSLGEVLSGVEVVDADAPVAVACDYDLVLTTPLGDTACEQTIRRWRAARLPPPPLEAIVGRVWIADRRDPLPGDRAVEVEWSVGDNPPVVASGSVGALELTGLDVVHVAARWRLACDDAEMPWSESVGVDAPAPPPPIVGLRVAVTRDSLARVSWEPATGAACEFKVTRNDGTIVYEGTSCSVVDWTGEPAASYSVISVRGGVASDPASAPTPPAWSVVDHSVMVRLPSVARAARAATACGVARKPMEIAGTMVAEVRGRTEPAEYAVVSGLDVAAALRAVEAAVRDPSGAAAPAVRVLCLAERGRLLVWSRSRDDGAWVVLARPIGAAEWGELWRGESSWTGALVWATATADGAVALRTSDPSDGPLGARIDGTQLELAADGRIVLPAGRPLFDAELTTRSSGPCVVVASGVPGAGDADVALWRDVADGTAAQVGRSIGSSSCVAPHNISPGVPTVVDAVVLGVAVRFVLVGIPLRGGRVLVAADVGSPVGSWRWDHTVAAGSPADLAAAAAELATFARRRLDGVGVRALSGSSTSQQPMHAP